MRKSYLTRFKDHLEAHRELLFWGQCVKKRRYDWSIPKCILAELIELGQHIPSPYGEVLLKEMHPRAVHTQRIWVFMRSPIRDAIYQHYCTDTNMAQKLENTGIKDKNQFYHLVRQGKDFYNSLKHEPFRDYFDYHELPEYYRVSREAQNVRI